MNGVSTARPGHREAAARLQPDLLERRGEVVVGEMVPPLPSNSAKPTANLPLPRKWAIAWRSSWTRREAGRSRRRSRRTCRRRADRRPPATGAARSRRGRAGRRTGRRPAGCSTVVSGGTSRRSSDRTTVCGSGLARSGPEATKAATPPIASRVRVPTVASRPTINRRMASLRSDSSGFDEIRPEGPDGVKHRRGAACRARCRAPARSSAAPRTGRRLSSKLHIESRRLAAMKAWSARPISSCGRSARRRRRTQMMSSQVKRRLRPKPSADAVVVDDDLRLAVARAADAQDHVVEHRQRQHEEQHEARVVQRQCRRVGRVADEVHDRHARSCPARPRPC